MHLLLKSILYSYFFIAIALGMSHPPLIVAPDPSANSVFLKNAELQPAATGTHASGDQHSKHGEGKNHNALKEKGEGYEKTAGFQENLGYKKKNKGNYGVQGSSGFSNSHGTKYGGGTLKANGGGGHEAHGGKLQGGSDGQGFFDEHLDRTKKFNEFMAALQADNSFKSYSHGDAKSYGDSYDNVEGFLKGDKGSFSESDGYEVKEGHDNKGGEKFIKQRDYNDDYEHKEGNSGNKKYEDHKQKSGHEKGHKSSQGDNGGKSDKYNHKSGHGNLHGHNKHAAHGGHHSSTHKEGHGVIHDTGNLHHTAHQASTHHAKHPGVAHHSSGQKGGHQEAHNGAGYNAGHHGEHHAGGANHQGSHHHSGQHASSGAPHGSIPVYYPHLVPPPPSGTAVFHPSTAATHHGTAEQHSKSAIVSHSPPLINYGAAVTYEVGPAIGAIIHEGGVVQHGTHLSQIVNPVTETAQYSQVQPILAATDDNVMISSLVHVSYLENHGSNEQEGDEETGNEKTEKQNNDGQIPAEEFSEVVNPVSKEHVSKTSSEVGDSCGHEAELSEIEIHETKLPESTDGDGKLLLEEEIEELTEEDPQRTNLQDEEELTNSQEIYDLGNKTVESPINEQTSRNYRYITEENVQASKGPFSTNLNPDNSENKEVLVNRPDLDAHSETFPSYIKPDQEFETREAFKSNFTSTTDHEPSSIHLFIKADYKVEQHDKNDNSGPKYVLRNQKHETLDHFRGSEDKNRTHAFRNPTHEGVVHDQSVRVSGAMEDIKDYVGEVGNTKVENLGQETIIEEAEASEKNTRGSYQFDDQIPILKLVENFSTSEIRFTEHPTSDDQFSVDEIRTYTSKDRNNLSAAKPQT